MGGEIQGLSGLMRRAVGYGDVGGKSQGSGELSTGSFQPWVPFPAGSDPSLSPAEQPPQEPNDASPLPRQQGCTLPSPPTLINGSL